MNVKNAKDIAHQWVSEESKKVPGFYGAIFIGSINWMPDEAAFSPTSDVDVSLIYESSNPPGEHRKFPYQGIVLEVSYLPSDHVKLPEMVLGDYPSACHFTAASIIADPSGGLAKLHEAVSKEYRRRKWVRKRCEHARDFTLASLELLKESESFHEQAFAWLPATIIPTHILLMAGLKNPTVRKCLVAAREVLARFDHLEIYPSMLDILGSTNMSRGQVEGHLESLVEMYDVTKEVIRTPFFFSDDISEHARPINIEANESLINAGYHREAMLWIAIVSTWCQKALYNDAPIEVINRFTPVYRHLLGDLGIHSYSDMQKRNLQNKDNLSTIWSVAETILAENPEIVD